jgi:hypothetical protein
MCAEHQREAWRKAKGGASEPGSRGRKRKSAAPPTVPFSAPPHCRVIAQKCDTCYVKQPIANFADGSRTCRRCAAALPITIVNPITKTIRRARIVARDLLRTPFEGTDAEYSAFIRAEQERGALVVVEWEWHF